MSRAKEEVKLIEEYLLKNKRLVTRDEILKDTGLKRRRWYDISPLAESRKLISSYGNREGRLYCHPSYHDSLKLEFMDVEGERKKVALANRNAYAKSYRQKAKTRNQESKTLTEKQGWAKFLGV